MLPVVVPASAKRVVRRNEWLVASGVAALALAVVLGGWLFFGRRTSRVNLAKGTLVIASAEGAEVFLNGIRRSDIKAGEPALEQLAPGDYEIVAKHAGSPDFVQRITLSSGGTASVFARFESTTKIATLKLSVTTDDARVFLDGQEISQEAANEPLRLSSETNHEVQVKREGFAEERFSVNLKAGETTERTITLKPGGSTPKKDSQRSASKGYEPKSSAPEDEPGPKKSAGSASLLDDDEEDHSPAPSSDETGFLMASTTPFARVLIDNKDINKMTPMPKYALPTGKHTVTFVVGSERFPFSIQIEAGKITRLVKPLPVGQP